MLQDGNILILSFINQDDVMRNASPCLLFNDPVVQITQQVKDKCLVPSLLSITFLDNEFPLKVN